MKKPKTKRREEFIECIVKTMKSKGVHDISASNEDKVKRAIYPELKQELEKYYKDKFPNKKDRTVQKWVNKNLVYESIRSHRLSNMHFMGANHRPDMAINDHISVAIEVKRGCNGASIREGIGQCMVYSTEYDFVVYLFIDTNNDKCIRNSLDSSRENQFIKMLWNEHNIKFVVV